MNQGRNFPLTLTVFLALGILTASLFSSSLWIEPNFGPAIANILYVVIRIGVLIGLGYVLSAWHKRSAFSTLSLVSLIIFMDQVPLKSWVFFHEQSLDPSDGGPLPMKALVVAFIIAYGLSLPIVFAFTMAGRILEQSLARRKGFQNV